MERMVEEMLYVELQKVDVEMAVSQMVKNVMIATH